MAYVHIYIKSRFEMYDLNTPCSSSSVLMLYEGSRCIVVCFKVWPSNNSGRCIDYNTGIQETLTSVQKGQVYSEKGR